MKTRFLLASALLLSAPVAALLPGCGGGSSTPTTRSFVSQVFLSPGQAGTVSLNVSGGVATGTFAVASSVINTARPTRALGALPIGSYPFSGTFSSPAAFSVGGTISSVGPFTIAGEVPNGGSEGAYTITVNGQSVQGSFFAPRTPTPQPTKRGVASANLTIFTTGDADFETPFFVASSGTVTGNDSSYTVTLRDGQGRAIEFKGEGASQATVGTSYSLGNRTSIKASTEFGNSTWGGAGAVAGTVKVKSVSSNQITFNVQSVYLSPSLLGPGDAKDNLILSGTITVPIT